jgi:hypothetical protein
MSLRSIKTYKAPKGVKVNGIHISAGNRKVRFPILSVGAALDCASRRWCPFDGDKYKEAGRRRCYAQISELLRPSVLVSRRRNEAIIAALSGKAIQETADRIARAVAGMLKGKRKGKRIMRINEAGDLSRNNIEFVCAVIKACKALDIACYLYSKAPPLYRRLAQEAGATVLHSEHEFIAVPTVAAGKATGLNRCPGVCGPCVACPSGVKSWIVEH